MRYKLPLSLTACLLLALAAGCSHHRSDIAATPRGYDADLRNANGAIDQDPQSADAYFARGFVYSLRGQADEAIDDYDRAIELNPGHAIAYENRGTMYYRKGQFSRALADYSKCIELKPDYAVAYENRAWAYYSLKDYDQAWADIRMCRAYGRSPDVSLVSAVSQASGRPE